MPNMNISRWSAHRKMGALWKRRQAHSKKQEVMLRAYGNLSQSQKGWICKGSPFRDLCGQGRPDCLYQQIYEYRVAIHLCEQALTFWEVYGGSDACRLLQPRL